MTASGWAPLVPSDPNCTVEWRPTRRYRLANWRGWPWNETLTTEPPTPQPYVAAVSVCGSRIGWNPVDNPECTTVVRLGWWVALAAVFGRRIDVEVSVRRDWRFPEPPPPAT